jgi:formylglycine-generating enzyme
MHHVVNIYPDTLAWIRDFTYSFNEPWATLYYWHPGYDDYPVVGVSWIQARAFSVWRTNFMNEHLRAQGIADVHNYRLPLETEWEYAARGGLDLSMYPWGGPYTRNYQGCFLANFKPLRGNYIDDGAVYNQGGLLRTQRIRIV